MMGKPRGRGPRNYDYNNAHRNVFISSSKECRASLLRWIPGKKFHPEYVTQAATPMWPIFDLRRFDTSVLLPQATLTPLLHAAPPLCVAAASCSSPSLDSTGPLGAPRPSVRDGWLDHTLSGGHFLGLGPVSNRCTKSRNLSHWWIRNTIFKKMVIFSKVESRRNFDVNYHTTYFYLV